MVCAGVKAFVFLVIKMHIEFHHQSTKMVQTEFKCTKYNAMIYYPVMI